MYLSITGEAVPWSRDSEDVVWHGGGGGEEVYVEVLAETSFGEMPCWDGILPKRGEHGWGHLMHAIMVGIERAFNPYPWGSNAEIERGEKQNKEFCLGVENGTTSTL